MEENLPVFASLEDSKVRQLLQNAAGVLLPLYAPPWRYYNITRLAKHWFPRLDTRFNYQGKSRQILLFRRLGVRHPDTLIFDRPSLLLESFQRHGSPWGYPVVLKGETGGGGSSVYPIRQPSDLSKYIVKLPVDQPVLLQKWVDHGGKDLRVVIYGQTTVSYFRVGSGGFYNNVCRGGRIDHDSDPHQRQAGNEAVSRFCRHALIDIAGFDLMFPGNGLPVFIEINFHFGHKGLGGVPGHHGHILQAVDEWRTAIQSSI
jgi:ribosomal protein S6--L-glutamate ligase